MVASPTYRQQHGLVTKIVFSCGYFLVIFSAGTFGSAFLLNYNAHVASTRWTETTGEVRNCNLGVYESYASMLHLGNSKVYALRCDLSYQIGGRPYRNSLHSDFTSSSRVRSNIVEWIALYGSGSNLTLRVNPKEPLEYYVQTPMPIKRNRENGDGFIYAGFAFAAVGLILIAVGRRLAPTGW
jgi:hypothetical protein